MVPSVVAKEFTFLPKPKRHIKSRARKRCGVLVGSQHPASFWWPASSVSRVLRRRTTGCTSSSLLLQVLLLDELTMGLRSSRDIIATFRWQNDGGLTGNLSCAMVIAICGCSSFPEFLFLDRWWVVGGRRGVGGGLWPYCCCLSLDHTIIPCCCCCCCCLSICAVLIIPAHRDDGNWKGWNGGCFG